MRRSTEELLWILFWACDVLTRPTFRNLTDSFECWAYRNGYGRDLRALERREFLERRSPDFDKPVYRLTDQGRKRALGGRDPTVCWARPWDGCWRLAVFDLPVGEDRVRRRLLRYLRAQHFGRLQRSVWLTPDALDTERCTQAGRGVASGCLVLLQAHPCGKESSRDVARLAWNFDGINEAYRDYLAVLAARPRASFSGPAFPEGLRCWASRERAAWLKAVAEDPMLPEELLPTGYLGQKAWQARLRLDREAPGFSFV